MLLWGMVLSAQTSVSGKIVDEDTGEGLFGATVRIAGAQIGTLSDEEGFFSLTNEKGLPWVLEITYLGYVTKEITITESIKGLRVELQAFALVDEVVITALGVEREEKALGYSVQKIGTEQIATVKPTNFVNTLAGKIAGVYVAASSAGPTASSNVNIRGVSSLLGNNQPLFVVNGMPITNELFSLDDGLNGSTTIDFGNAAQIINPDDIESINVLKGPAASALYGSRAADGVILIETKTGKGTDGWGVNVNTSNVFSSVLKMPDYQNIYGFGGGGKYSYLNGSNYIGDKEYYEAYGENWGPAMNGQLVKQFNSNGEAVPFTASPNNIRDFYQTGVTSINNISLNNAGEDSDLRLSFTRLDKRGIVPNSDLRRNTVQLSIGRELFEDKLSVRANAMYINSRSGNVPNSGYDESSSIQYGWLWYPRQVDINDLRDYWQPGLEGVEQRYVENLWVNNPWFIVNENTNAFQNNRLIGNLQARYQFTDKLSARFRYGIDILDESRQYRRAPSTKAVLLGSYREDEVSFAESNAELLVSFSNAKDYESPFQYDFKIGGNIMRQNAGILVANNPQLKFFGTDESIYTLTNARSGVLVESQKSKLGINSLFAYASLAYRNFLYLDATFRNDWSSTLVNPVAGISNSNFSFGYPSISFSAIVSEILNLSNNSPLSFLKLKANYAEVGNGSTPYSFGTTFTPQAPFGSNSVFTTNRTVADPNLTNERTRAFEVGADIRLWLNRLRIDATYYNMLSFDQIIELPVAKASGFDFVLTNGGSIRNKGMELFISGTPFLSDKFSWDVTVNIGRNRAFVETLPSIIESGRYSIVADVFPGDEGGSDLEYVAVEGQLLGQLYGLGFVRDPSTNQIIHQNGLPMITEEKVSAGSYQPDVRLGIQNSFTYKDFSFSFLVDGQIGGKIYSRSHALYNTGGAITNNDDPNLAVSTLDGRDVYNVSYDEFGDPVYTLGTQGGGVVGPGLKWTDNNNDGVIDYSNELSPNDVAVQPGGIGYVGYFYTYYGNGFNRDNIEAATFDATYFKLREVSITYSLPKKLLGDKGIKAARFSLIGGNLFLFSKVPTIDPETYSIRNGLFVNGFESTQIFSTRRIGFSVNLGF